MVEKNELNRSLLALLDENIANAHIGNQVKVFPMKAHPLLLLQNLSLVCYVMLKTILKQRPHFVGMPKT